MRETTTYTWSKEQGKRPMKGFIPTTSSQTTLPFHTIHKGYKERTSRNKRTKLLVDVVSLLFLSSILFICIKFF